MTSIFVLISALFFLASKILYPITLNMLEPLGVFYDFDDISIDWDGNLSIENLKFSYKPEGAGREVVNVQSGYFSLSIGQKFGGIFKNHWVLHSLILKNSFVELDFGAMPAEKAPADEDAASKMLFKIPSKWPFFPLEQLDIENLNLNLKVDEKSSVKVSGLSFNGDKNYLLSIPDITLVNPSLDEEFSFDFQFGFMAHDTKYQINSLAFNTKKGLSLNAEKIDSGKLNGRLDVDLSKVAEFFKIDLGGEFYLNFDTENIDTFLPRLFAEKQKKERKEGEKKADDGKADLSFLTLLPRTEITFSVSNLKFDDFRPWDMHAHIRTTPTRVFIERFNFFHKNKVSISLDGVFPFSERKVSGNIKLYDFDFDNCLRRMGTSGLVNMIITGDIKYDFMIDNLLARTWEKLVVTEFDVMNKKILDLPRPRYDVTGQTDIGPNGVDLNSADVVTKNEASHIKIRGAHFGFADTMKFHFPIVKGSWIDLEDVKMIAGFEVKGKGPIEVLLTSFYKNPVVTSDLDATGCHFAGFNAEKCHLGINMEDFFMTFDLKEIRQRSISSKNSQITIDFDDPDMAVTFKINKAEGNLKDSGAVFGVDTGSLFGHVFLDASGKFTNGLASLRGELRIKDFVKRNFETNETLKLLDSIELKLSDKDSKELMAEAAALYGRNSIKLNATISKSDFDTNLKLWFDQFYPEDLDFLPQEVTFGKPDLDIALTGVLSHPNVTGKLKIPSIKAYDIKFGNLSVGAEYEGESQLLTADGSLGKTVKFDMSMKDFDAENLLFNMKVKNFVHRISDIYIKVSANGSVKNKKINIDVPDLKFQKDFIFVQNVKPFNIFGDIDNLKIREETHFDGEFLHFSVAGGLYDFSPDLALKGIFFFRNMRILEEYRQNSLSGRLIFDLSIIDSDIKGHVDVMDVDYVLDEPRIVFKNFNGSLVIDNNIWKISELKGRAGDGMVIVKGGGLIPLENASVNISAVNLTGKLDWIGDFATTANVDFIVLSRDQYSLSGDVELKNIVCDQPLSLDNDFIKTISKLGKGKANADIQKSMPIDFNLKVHGQNNLRVRTNLVDADLFLDLFLTGNARKPNLDGVILIKNGKVAYKQNDFATSRGNITFENDGINPYLDFQGSSSIITKVQDNQKDFKVTMTVTGYPLEDDLDIRFDSVPQLDDAQLQSLLLWGNIGDNFSGDLAIAAVTDIIGLTSEVRKNFNFSRFELTPKYSEIDDKTVLKIIAEKEIYKNLFLLLESNPSEAMDHIIDLKYRAKNLEAVLEWKNKDLLETNFGGIGFDLKLDFIVE